jgi:cobalt-zinc-cadmium efflux system outer membrane protein
MTQSNSYSSQCLKILVAALVLTATPWGAARGESLTLDEALRAARAINSRLQSARHAVESARGRAERAGAWPNPALSFAAEEVPRGGSVADGKSVVGLSQTLPFPLKKSYDGRAGRSETEGFRADFETASIALERDVKIAFYQVLAAQRSLTISREALGVATALADAARRRVESGAAPLQEELRAEIERERANSDLVAREAEHALARASLFALMGTPGYDGPLAGDLSADTAFPGALPADSTVAPSIPEPGFARSSHPLLEGAEARVRRAEQELRRVKLEPLPDLDLRLAAGRDANDSDIVEFEAAISIPFFDFSGGLRREKRAELEAARAEATAIAIDFETSRRKTTETFRAAARQTLAYRDDIVPRAERALELVRGGFDAGKFGLIDLLDTQRTLAEARLAYIERLLELNSARAEWEALNVEAGDRHAP